MLFLKFFSISSLIDFILQYEIKVPNEKALVWRSEYGLP